MPRAVATTLILLAQVQLLWVAAVHWHDLPLAPLSAKLQRSNTTQPPVASGTDVLCPACNLIHQSATQATSAVSAQRSNVSERYRLAPSPVRLRTCDLPVLRGRAPPLS